MTELFWITVGRRIGFTCPASCNSRSLLRWLATASTNRWTSEISGNPQSKWLLKWENQRSLKLTGSQWEVSIAMFDSREGPQVRKLWKKCGRSDRFPWASCFLSESYFDNSALKFSMFATYQAARNSNGHAQTDSTTIEIVQERLAVFEFAKHAHFEISKDKGVHLLFNFASSKP